MDGFVDICAGNPQNPDPTMTLQTPKYAKNTSRASMAKRRIMETATQLFAERGYGNVGINEVGVTAGFGKGALYYHIRSKEDLLVSIISEHMEGMIADARDAAAEEGKTSDRTARLVGAFVEALFENTDAMTVSYRDIHAIVDPGNIRIVADIFADYRKIWSEMFTTGALAGEHRDIAETEIETFLAMLFSSVFWVGDGSKRTTIAATFAHTINSAVAAPR